ncbi:unnamed protein product [Sphagnum jensenii]
MSIMDSKAKCLKCGEWFSTCSNLHRHIRQAHRTNLNDSTVSNDSRASSALSSVSRASSVASWTGSMCGNDSLSGGEKLNHIVKKSASYNDFVDRLKRCITFERSHNVVSGFCAIPELEAVCNEIKQNDDLGSVEAVGEALQRHNTHLQELFRMTRGSTDSDDWKAFCEYVCMIHCDCHNDHDVIVIDLIDSDFVIDSLNSFRSAVKFVSFSSRLSQ